MTTGNPNIVFSTANLYLKARHRPHGVANCCIAFSSEGHDNPAGGGAVHLADHEVDFAHCLSKTPWVALPIISVHGHWDGQELQNV